MNKKGWGDSQIAAAMTILFFNGKRHAEHLYSMKP
jgi:hypothetical protein